MNRCLTSSSGNRGIETQRPLGLSITERKQLEGDREPRSCREDAEVLLRFALNLTAVK